MSESDNGPSLPTLELDGLGVEQAVVRLIGFAADLSASDIFLSPGEDDASISLRCMGIVKALRTLPREQLGHLVNHVKAVAGMAVDQHRRPLDGRWVCTIDKGSRVELRVSTVPTLWGESMTIRVVKYDPGLLELQNLGFHKRNLRELSNLLHSPSGMILMAGPAGAGKTTTLYACLNRLNDGTRKINTIEDPIEFAMAGVDQSEIQPRIGLDFPQLLRSILRHSPDVIMIGEIRDPVTAETAVAAANSGHLVFATLHSPIAASAIDSMLALGTNPHFLASSLLGAVSQRLVRRLCEHCKVGFDLSAAPRTFDDVRKWLEPGQGEKIYSAPGCEHCNHEGYVGRTGVAEVLRVSKEIRRLICEKRSVKEIRQQAIHEGMIDLRGSALLKVAQGITSTEEVVRTIPAEHLLPEG